VFHVRFQRPVRCYFSVSLAAHAVGPTQTDVRCHNAKAVLIVGPNATHIGHAAAHDLQQTPLPPGAHPTRRERQEPVLHANRRAAYPSAMNPTNYSLFGHIARGQSEVRRHLGHTTNSPFFVYNHTMISAAVAVCQPFRVRVIGHSFFTAGRPAGAAASAGRILLLPKRIVSGETATLAVLDAGGRLTPGVTVNFSNGDHVVTNPTGARLVCRSLKTGVIYAAIASQSTRVYATILTPAEAATSFSAGFIRADLCFPRDRLT